jgi:hypothetical protein
MGERNFMPIVVFEFARPPLGFNRIDPKVNFYGHIIIVV